MGVDSPGLRLEMRPSAALLLVSLIVFVGCSGSRSVDKAAVQAAADGSSEGSSARKASRVREVAEATVGVSSANAVAGAEEPFVSDPGAGGGSGYHADTVLGVRYASHDGYERAVMDLGTGEDPAQTVPRWSLSSSRGDGLLRVTLPSANATGVTEGRFGEGSLKSFHVVHAPDGGLFVDYFARKAFRYRVLEVEDPARLVVDVKPAEAPLKAPLPAEGGETVLVEPRSGARISDPLIVSGYSRNFEASNTITLADATGEVVARRIVHSNDWSSTWGYFEATLDLPPFSGEGALRVGTTSVRDGSFRGVEIPVRGS
ncbi:MAG: Gmad2 immunoglobulin-like domain-containing protein [Rubrobacter sp.]